MAIVPAAAFKNMIFKAGKGLSKGEARKADATIQKALATKLAGMAKAVGTVESVDQLKLAAGKHGKIHFKAKASTLKGGESLVAKLKGWLSKKGEVTLGAPKLKTPKSSGMFMPNIESGGVFSRPTGGWDPYQNLVEQNRVGFF